MQGGQAAKNTQTTPFITFLKTLLMVFNFIFWVAGVIILAVGVWIRVDLYKYMQVAANYYHETPYVLIGIGAGIVLIGILACCCTKKGHAALLYIFSLFLFVIFIAMLAVGIAGLIYKGKIEQEFGDGLEDAMEKYAKDDPHAQKAMDSVQVGLKCCGKDSFADWFKFLANSSVPLSCCKDQTKTDTCKNTELDEAAKPETLDIHTDGCLPEATQFVKGKFAIIGGVCLGFAFLQLLGALLSCCLAKNINKNKYEAVQ